MDLLCYPSSVSACDGFQIGQITTSTACPLYPTDLISITSGGNWTCPLGRTCKWRYFRYLPSEWIEGATFSGSAPPANFQGTADCNGGFERVDVYFSEVSPDPKTLAMYSVIWNPCSTPPPILLKQPSEGSVLNYQCNTAISGKVYGTIPPNETEVTIDVDGQTTTAPLAGDGTFSTNSTILTGTHTATASYSGGSDTNSFSSTCKSIEFESLAQQDDSRIIIHKYGTEAYSSPNQLTDGEIQVKLTVKVNLQPASGQEVFFRIKDPDDPSPYETDTTQDDNFGGAIGSRAILGSAGVTNPSPGVWKASSDSNGLIIVTLQIPGSANNPAGPDYKAAAAGDNYQIEASFDDFVSNPNPQYLVVSPIFSAWKRVYIEKDRIYRKGGLLVEDCISCSTLLAASSSNVKKNDQIIVFDEKNVESNPRKVTKVVDNPDGSKSVTLQSPVSGTYIASGPPKVPGGNYQPRDFANTHSGGFGVVGSGFFEASLASATSLTQAFGNDAFLEILETTDGASDLPYFSSEIIDSSGQTRAAFNKIWFKHFLPLSPEEPLVAKPQNCFHVVGMTLSGNPILAGITNPFFDYSYILVERIEGLNGLTATQKANHIKSTTAHEIAHQFRVNPDTCDWHDSRQAWCGGEIDTSCGSELCLMNSSRDATNDVDKLDTIDLLKGTASAGSISCNGIVFSYSMGDGAIRTHNDPE